jgi:hypothetical protein
MCVFTYCEKNSIPNPFVKEKGMAGHAWVEGFFCRLDSQTGIGQTAEPIQIRSRPIRAYEPQGEKPSESPYRDKGPLNVWDTPDGGGDETPVQD